MTQLNYILALNGVFWSIQGEGHLQGFQQLFIRLAGCSVGCSGCDTNYLPYDTVSLAELIRRCKRALPENMRGDVWVWVTGGEPADLPQIKQVQLVSALHDEGWNVCVASSGSKRFIPPVEWLSISPHTVKPTRLMQRYANEVKLIDGLNGLDLNEWAERWDNEYQAMYRYVQPLSVLRDNRWVEDPASLQRCLDFLSCHPHWALSQQRHHQWGVL